MTHRGRPRSLALAVKRAIDVVGSAVGLILAAPLMGAIAIAIKVESRGPVLFRQQRSGLGDRPFSIYKFRSMVVDADRHGPVTTLDDPRVTRVGRWLRLTSLDELPQLFNVLKGDMSLVGPRPLLPDTLLPGEARRTTMRPGITSLPAVTGRQSLSWDERIDLDLRYVDEWSLWLDASILWRTVVVVISRRDVYDADGEMKERSADPGPHDARHLDSDSQVPPPSSKASS